MSATVLQEIEAEKRAPWQNTVLAEIQAEKREQQRTKLWRSSCGVNDSLNSAAASNFLESLGGPLTMPEAEELRLQVNNYEGAGDEANDEFSTPVAAAPDEPKLQPNVALVQPNQPIVQSDEPKLQPDEPKLQPDQPELFAGFAQLLAYLAFLQPDQPELLAHKPELQPDQPELLAHKPELQPDQPELFANVAFVFSYESTCYSPGHGVGQGSSGC